jgi:hypothetical protein
VFYSIIVFVCPVAPVLKKGELDMSKKYVFFTKKYIYAIYYHDDDTIYINLNASKSAKIILIR